MNDELSVREQQVLALLHAGMTQKEVAFELRLQHSTVRVHVWHARNKVAGQRTALDR